MEISNIRDDLSRASRSGVLNRTAVTARIVPPAIASWFEARAMNDNRNPAQSRELLHPALIGPGAALLMAAFATDIVYSRTLLFQWNNLSIWLITGGLIVAALSGLALILDVALGRIRAIARWRLVGLALAALLSLLNAFVHSRDAYTAVVPRGLELSGLVTVLLLILGWHGWNLAVHPSSKPSASIPSAN